MSYSIDRVLDPLWIRMRKMIAENKIFRWKYLEYMEKKKDVNSTSNHKTKLRKSGSGFAKAGLLTTKLN